MSFEAYTSTVSIFEVEAYGVSDGWGCGQSGIVYLSALSTMSAALETMEVSCHLKAFAKNNIDSIEVVH